MSEIKKETKVTKKSHILREYALIDEVMITGDKPTDFVVKKVSHVISEIDIDKEIQAAAKGASLKDLVIKAISTGDDSVLNQREGFYGDISDMPKDPIQAHNLVKNADRAWNKLPKEIKEGKTKEEVAAMTKEDIAKLVSDIIAKNNPVKSETKVEVEKEVVKDGE